MLLGKRNRALLEEVLESQFTGTIPGLEPAVEG